MFIYVFSVERIIMFRPFFVTLYKSNLVKHKKVHMSDFSIGGFIP